MTGHETWCSHAPWSFLDRLQWSWSSVHCYRWDILIEILEAQKQRISSLGIEFKSVARTEVDKQGRIKKGAANWTQNANPIQFYLFRSWYFPWWSCLKQKEKSDEHKENKFWELLCTHNWLGWAYPYQARGWGCRTWAGWSTVLAWGNWSGSKEPGGESWRACASWPGTCSG